jgi:hypothetical protein
LLARYFPMPNRLGVRRRDREMASDHKREGSDS